MKITKIIGIIYDKIIKKIIEFTMGVLIILKILNLINLSWWIIFSPILVSFIYVVPKLLIIYLDKQQEKK